MVFLFYILLSGPLYSGGITNKMTESNGKSFGMVLDGIFVFLAFILFLYLWGHFYSLFGKNTCSCFSNFGLICAYFNFYFIRADQSKKYISAGSRFGEP